jgi:uncharacterized membrane protein YkgB
MTTEGAAINARAVGRSTAASDRVQTIGAYVLRYGLVLVLGWIGAMKFTGYEAVAFSP